MSQRLLILSKSAEAISLELCGSKGKTFPDPPPGGQRPEQLPAEEPRVAVGPRGLAREGASGSGEAVCSTPPNGPEIASDHL